MKRLKSFRSAFFNLQQLDVVTDNVLRISPATTWKTLNFYEAASFTVPNTKFMKALTKLKDIKSLQSRNAFQQKETRAV